MVREPKNSQLNRLHIRALTLSACEVNLKISILAFTVILICWQYQGLTGDWSLREPRRLRK